MLLEPDLRPAEPIAGGFTASVITPSPDGSVVAVGEFKARGHFLPCRVLLIDPATGRTLREVAFLPEPLKGKDGGIVQDGVKSLAFGPDGKRLFVGTQAARVYRYDLDQPGDRPATTWRAQTGWVEHLVAGPDGTVYTANRSDRGVVRWGPDGKQLGEFATDTGIRVIALDPGTGRLLASDSRAVYRLDPATLRPDDPNSPGWETSPRQMAVTPGGRVLVAATHDRAVLADGTGRCTS